MSPKPRHITSDSGLQVPFQRTESRVAFVAAIVIAVALYVYERSERANGRALANGAPLGGLVLLGGALAGMVAGGSTSIGTTRGNGALVLLVFVAAALATFGGWEEGRTWPRASGLLVAVSALGVYATVPDTEHALALLGAAAVVAVAAWIAPVCRLGPWGTAAGALAVVGIALVDNAGRDSALLRGAACAGVFLLAPVARRLRTSMGRAARAPRGWLDTATVVVLHTAVVGLCAALNEHRRSAVDGLVVAVPVLALGLLALVVVAPAGEP